MMRQTAFVTKFGATKIHIIQVDKAVLHCSFSTGSTCINRSHSMDDLLRGMFPPLGWWLSGGRVCALLMFLLPWRPLLVSAVEDCVLSSVPDPPNFLLW